jgi:site-specific DNA recombinase
MIRCRQTGGAARARATSTRSGTATSGSLARWRALPPRARGRRRTRPRREPAASKIRTTEAAIDRYLAAFENGALNETVCGHRIRDLTAKLDQLATRRAELTEMLDRQPKPPSAAAINQLPRDLVHVFNHGTPGQREAIIGTHIAEVKIQEPSSSPVYKIHAEAEGQSKPRLAPTFRTASMLWSERCTRRTTVQRLRETRFRRV